jgi:hypothetical protein
MPTIANTKASALTSGQTAPQGTYLDALSFLDEYEPVAEAISGPTAPPCPDATYSLWILGNLLAHEPAARSEPVQPPCGFALGTYRHFNVAWSELRNKLAHCDFHSVDLPDLTNALKAICDAQSLWDTVLNLGIDDTEQASITYADVDYPPRPRNYAEVAVRIDSFATRIARRYTDADAETWGP